jgi:hypothetical protein
MRWYLRFWWHNWRAHVWKCRAKDARVAMTVAETNQWHHEGEWQCMKQALKDFK